MPFKFHASRRHHIPRAKYRVMNWPDYDRGLVRRGDIRFWIDESALEQWDAAKRRTPGGQRRFSELAISTTLMLGVVFRLPLRQTEGFVRSLVDLMGCDLPVPDHTTLSRRRRTVDVVVETSTNKRSTDIVLDSTGLKFFGAGEWARAKHGETRRSWRKLHISVDPASSEIRTHELTGDDTADATMAGPLVAGSGGMIRRVFADGAYDGEPVTKAIREALPPNSPPGIIIPPRATSIPLPDTPHGGSEREHHAAEIASKGRMNWQKRQGYGLRALGETAMARVKRLNGGKLNARTFQSQQTEIAMQIDVLNRSIRAAKPNTIRRYQPGNGQSRLHACDAWRPTSASPSTSCRPPAPGSMPSRSSSRSSRRAPETRRPLHCRPPGRHPDATNDNPKPWTADPDKIRRRHQVLNSGSAIPVNIAAAAGDAAAAAKPESPATPNLDREAVRKLVREFCSNIPKSSEAIQIAGAGPRPRRAPRARQGVAVPPDVAGLGQPEGRCHPRRVL